MFPMSFEPENVIPVMLFAIPIIAITGGIVMGVVRAAGRQRLIELAQQERIAAIQRGVDPEKIPPINLGFEEGSRWGDFADASGGPLRRAQGLLIGGMVTLFAGAGIALFLGLVNPEPGRPFWAVGLVPAAVGVALLLSAKFVWPRNGH